MELCYNKGCGKKYDPESNTDDACCYHPGVPVFHDALKSWSCCTKRVTDFTAFLEIKGCTTGKHSNVKPPEPEKPAADSAGPVPQQVVHKPTVEFVRPDENDPLQDVAHGEVTASLRAAIEQERKRLESAPQTNDADKSANGSQTTEIKIGTRCRNKGCNVEYAGSSTPIECQYHAGEAVFHEGMKYWSCCQRKTSDFTAFLEQRGCSSGDHRFVADPNDSENATLEKPARPACRFDWHQTSTLVTISVFAKNAVPERCIVRANHCVCEVTFVFDHGRSIYSNRFRLFGSVEPSASSVRFLQPKVEINFRKKDPLSWAKLEYVEPKKQSNGNGNAADGEAAVDA